MLLDAMEIELLAVTAVTIHSSLYYDITYRNLANGQMQRTRINPEAFYENPQAGDHVQVNIVLGNIMGATRLDPVARPEATA